MTAARSRRRFQRRAQQRAQARRGRTAARHQPLRRCVACRSARPPAELIRFVRDAAGAWRLDPEHRAGGRGAWVCRDNAACHQERALRRFFRARAGSVAAALEAYRSTHTATPSRDGGNDV